METNFFQNLAGLQVEGGWRIVVMPDKEGKLVVSALFFNDKVGDDARVIIPPLNLKGTPEEIDKGFFNAIANPVKTTDGLLRNMEQYLKAQEAAKTKSKMEQSNTQKKGKEKEADDPNKKFEAQMKKVDDLAAQGKFGEAIAQLPKAEDYPDKADEIQDKHDQLWVAKKEKENALF